MTAAVGSWYREPRCARRGISLLAGVSSKRFGTRLPGDFAARHRALGELVFVGLCFTALSATGRYFAAFVL